MNKKIIKEYSFIRVVATVLVVIGHAGYLSMETKYGGITLNINEVSFMQKIIELIIRFIYSFHMPLFFALSGGIFKLSLMEKKNNLLKQIVKIKMKRLIVPFFLVTLGYVIPIKYFINYFSIVNNKVNSIILGQIFLCGNTHLWFLVVLFQITIIVYFIEKIKSYYLKIGLVVFIFYLGTISKIEFLGISRVLINILWFYMGILYQENYLYLKKIILKNMYGYLKIAIFLEVIILLIYLYFFKNNIYFYTILNFNGIILSLLFSYFFIETNITNKKIYKIILKNSFIIYLLSDTNNYIFLFIIKKYNYYNIITSNKGTILLFVIRVLITLFVPIVITIIFNKIKNYKKLLICSEN